MGRRNDHTREEIRQMALEAAQNLLEDEGPAGLSARKVSAKIGYTVGTLYLVFANLDDLIFQLNLHTLKRLRKSLLESVGVADTPVTILKAMADAYLRFARQNPHLWRMLYAHPQVSASPVYGEYHAVIGDLFTLVEQALGGVKDTGHQALSLQARAVWGGVHGICSLALDDKLNLEDGVSIKQATDLLIERFVKGG